MPDKHSPEKQFSRIMRDCYAKRKNKPPSKTPKLTPEQLNQRKALKYYLGALAYRDKELREVVNTQTEKDNIEILEEFFGFYDSASVPDYGFDGCVIYNY